MSIRRRRERAQALPILALLLVAFIGLLGLAIDVGRLVIARAELSRAVDAAALAGVTELPDVSGAQAVATTYVAENVPDATTSFPASDEEYQLRVQGSRSVEMLFMKAFGIGNVDIDVTAAAGFGVPLDIVLVLDDTGTMKSGCNSSQTNDDCPIKQAKESSHAFVDDLLGSNPSGIVQMGLVRFRGCYGTQRYNPVSGEDPDRGCVLFDESQGLTSNAALLHAAIDNAYGQGGFPGTNICSGLDEGWNMVTGAGSRVSARKVLVVLSDGDNRYSDGAQNDARGNPVPNVYPPPSNGGSGDCIPSGPDQDGNNYGPDYDNRIGNLDDLTYAKALDIGAADIEIYVAGYKVAGNAGAEESDCDANQVGTGGSRNNGSSDPQDRNLNKCIATSTSGTNDHYLEAPTAEDIPEIFQAIATNIAFRLVE